ncbi:MAG: hypothetical protein GF416_09365 [Candidatus Altiarchaeales archaeon]|nr:hypothetical protein [Candidatus Altiarchaeales archaeon]MBD3417328.1 hypothetical protein [Candidatus Altiarchaeales archaeon]
MTFRVYDGRPAPPTYNWLWEVIYMHGRHSSEREEIRELMREIDFEVRKPNKDYRRIKNLWWRIYNLQQWDRPFRI